MLYQPVTQAQELAEPSAGRDYASTRRPDEGIQSVTRALHLLEVLRQSETAMGVSELGRESGIPKSTVHRLVVALEASGHLERVGKRYRIGWRLFDIGNSVHVCRPQGLRDVAIPHMTDLHKRTGQATELGVLHQGDVIFLAKVFDLNVTSAPTPVGGRVPASCSAIGKVILAHSPKEVAERIVSGPLTRQTPYSITESGRLLNELAQIRETGLAIDREESTLGLSSVAAPIWVAGRVVAAVAITGRTTAWSGQLWSQLVRRTASSIGEQVTVRSWIDL